jgi:hypothetical protein
MVKVSGPLFSKSASGSVGQLTFRQLRGVTLAYGRPRAGHLRKGLAQYQGEILWLVSAYWGILDTFQQSEWNAYATPPMTGFSLFCQRFTRVYCRFEQFFDFLVHEPSVPADPIFILDRLYDGISQYFVDVANVDPKPWAYTLWASPKKSVSSVADWSRRKIVGTFDCGGQGIFYFSDPFPNNYVTVSLEAVALRSGEVIPLRTFDKAPRI